MDKPMISCFWQRNYFLKNRGLWVDFLFVGVFGLFWGSFLGVLADRQLSEESAVFSPKASTLTMEALGLKGFARSPVGLKSFARSKCDSCHTTLNFYELVPLFSFLFLRGRCSHCRATIPWRYPLYELTTGLALGASAELCRALVPFFGEIAAAIFFAALFFFWSVGFVLFVTDLEQNFLSEKNLGLLGFGGLAVLLARHMTFGTSVFHSVIATILGILFAVGVRTFFGHDKFGSGDVWLIGILGLWLGKTLPFALLLGSLFAVFGELSIRPWRKRGVQRIFLPLGSWLLLAGFLVLCANGV